MCLPKFSNNTRVAYPTVSHGKGITKAPAPNVVTEKKSQVEFIDTFDSIYSQLFNKSGVEALLPLNEKLLTENGTKQNDLDSSYDYLYESSSSYPARHEMGGGFCFYCNGVTYDGSNYCSDQCRSMDFPTPAEDEPFDFLSVDSTVVSDDTSSIEDNFLKEFLIESQEDLAYNPPTPPTSPPTVEKKPSLQANTDAVFKGLNHFPMGINVFSDDTMYIPA